jgi:hypothetical protein
MYKLFGINFNNFNCWTGVSSYSSAIHVVQSIPRRHGFSTRGDNADQNANGLNFGLHFIGYRLATPHAN